MATPPSRDENMKNDVQQPTDLNNSNRRDAKDDERDQETEPRAKIVDPTPNKTSSEDRLERVEPISSNAVPEDIVEPAAGNNVQKDLVEMAPDEISPEDSVEPKLGSTLPEDIAEETPAIGLPENSVQDGSSQRRASSSRGSEASEDSVRFIPATHKNFLEVVKDPKPGARFCNWAQFKTRILEEPPFSIDVLMAKNDLKLQVYEESIKRSGDEVENLPNTEAMSYEDITIAMMEDDTLPQMQRIRIQSQVILGLLNKVTGSTWNVKKSHTFMRPFGYSIHHLGRVKEEFERLQSRNTQEKSDEHGTQNVTEQDNCPPSLAQDRMSESNLEEIRSYITFVEGSLIPLYRQFEATSDSSTTISFDELWYLFRPNELVHIPLFTFSETHPKMSRQATSEVRGEQTTWRVSTAIPNCGGVRSGLFFNENISKPQYEANNQGAFLIRYYYLDYNGKRIISVGRSYTIEPFVGKKEIRTLDIYPLRFLANWKEARTEGIDRGRKFISAIESKHMLFSGIDLWQHPDGHTKYDSYHVDKCDKDEVIVDFEKALLSERDSYFDYQPAIPYETKFATTLGVYRVLAKPSERERNSSGHFELIVWRDDVHRFEHAENLESNRFIGYAPPTIQAFNELQDHDDDFMLLPYRMSVYNVRLRKFLHVNVLGLKPIERRPDTLDNLQIEDENRHTIKGVVESHIKRENMAKAISYPDTLNLIPGKGHGLLILIHGAPGIGKTATAEAVAHFYERPLISIQDLDIEYTGEKLVRLFQHAEDWNCILLLDEADVYLPRRSPHEQYSNVIVSLFLRILETFNGILFLTTNRPGSLDEAVTSRIQLNIWYKPLDLNRTVGIFRLLIDQLETSEKKRASTGEYTPMVICKSQIISFAQNHFHNEAFSKGIGLWNGRQIKNAFRIASSLAQYEAFNESPDFQVQPLILSRLRSFCKRLIRIPKQLRGSHFKEVERLTLDYDINRSGILGLSDSENAKQRNERNDYPKKPHASPAQRPPLSSSSYHIDSRNVTPSRSMHGGIMQSGSMQGAGMQSGSMQGGGMQGGGMQSGSFQSGGMQGGNINMESSPSHAFSEGDVNTRRGPQANITARFEQSRREASFEPRRHTGRDAE